MREDVHWQPEPHARDGGSDCRSTDADTGVLVDVAGAVAPFLTGIAKRPPPRELSTDSSTGERAGRQASPNACDRDPMTVQV